jgi:3-oxoacyl-[acyl-carrier protein] reductase
MYNVLVTGGSRGLGLATARKLRCAGYRVIALARSETAELTSLMKETESGITGSVEFVPFDLARIEEIPALVRRVRKQVGPVYGLVNNAGISYDGVFSLMHDSRIEELIRMNTLSPIILTKYVIRSMMADGAGRVVNVSSIIASSGYKGLAVYGATKASLLGFTRSLAREVGPLGINVNSIAPGFVATSMTRELGDEMRQKVVRRSALLRLAESEDVANAIEFLLSDKARNITGTVITVDAGNTA